MQGPMVQALALVAVGNRVLHGHDVSGFWPDATVFRFTKRCEFVSEPLDWGYTPTASFRLPDPQAWYEWLRPHASEFWLDFQRRDGEAGSDRQLVGLVGGGPRWILGVRGRKGSDLWEGHDRVEDQNDPQQKIWATAYNRFGEGWTEAPGIVRPEVILRWLEKSLPPIEAFAAEIGADRFRKAFQDALAKLRAPEIPDTGFYADIARLGGLDGAARRLLAVASDAWVFGAMGSWNDLGFEGEQQQRYDALSEDLFEALVHAMASIANSTRPA